MKYKKSIAIGMVTIYAIFASVMCVPMAVAAHEGLSLIGVENELVGLEIKDKESYGHCAIQINEVVYEPRYLGMYKQSNIDYNPIMVYTTTEELLIDYDFFPTPSLIFSAISEMIE